MMRHQGVSPVASTLSNPIFHSEEAAYAHVEARIWPDGPFCPHCGECERISAIKPNIEKRVRIGLKKCGSCKKQFTVKVGTVFEQSHVPLNLWLQAVALICASKKGFSSNQLARVLGVTIKTAWFMSHRIRAAMADGSLDPFGSGGGDVEADETYIGHDPAEPRQHVAFADKLKVLTLVDRNTGRARSRHMEFVTSKTIADALGEEIAPDARLITDAARHFRRAGNRLRAHESVNHSVGEYVRADDPSIHTNTVEGTFSIFKRGMRGIYQHCAKKHLHRYLAEFDFRYSNRIALGINDSDRADAALQGIRGKRLTYRTTSQRRPGAEDRVVW
jgi:transposase-like protein